MSTPGCWTISTGYPPLPPPPLLILFTNPPQLSSATAALADTPAADIMDGLRTLERKTGLVFTLLKASVYSMVLQQQLEGEEGGDGGVGSVAEMMGMGMDLDLD